MIIATLTPMFFVIAMLTFFSLLAIIALFVGKILPYLLGIKPPSYTDFEEVPVQKTLVIVTHKLETPSGILELQVGPDGEVLRRFINGEEYQVTKPTKFIAEKRQFVIQTDYQQEIIVPIERKEQNEN